ncbi:hypothetical protein IE81DRAFT_323049 [Ceraceosorus guamensis]|uniref:Uncharacterized protein n=1 Tax=Ceraceosorus guamensis TaxID=1522189 RepID=A0A316VZ19_9BASI|nr:hypothetical protein IE81DRAFT_323049 [Ceraceosorus guamensis]PWN42907.1 hypothetical protein IE81DRAFT_323049 [Ceraceosorus guamensis]
MFRATSALFSKASRLPLTSKKANKDFYKGTGALNVLRRKRIALADRKGQQLDKKTWTLMTHRLDELRVPAYIVPPGLNDTNNLRPYVYRGSEEAGGTPVNPKSGYPDGPRMTSAGFDAAYYRKVSGGVYQRRAVKDGVAIEEK